MRKRRLLAGILAALMLVNGPNMAYAAAEDMTVTAESTNANPAAEEDATEDRIPVLNYHGDEERKIPSIQQKSPNVDRGETLPASYQSSYVTSIKDQNPYGTCWAHAAIAASEADIWKKGMTTTEPDLSEWQLAYFCYHTVTDPLGGTQGDSIVVPDNGSNTDYLDRGGNQQVATFRLATWQGVTAESEAVYTNVVADRTKTLDNTLAYGKDSYHLENAYWVSMQDREIVKQLIMEYGACATSYYHDSAYYNSTNQWYASKPLAEYKPSGNGTNHAITIIGWDDNYSKDNFGTSKPASDGAWLCKNSWSADWSKDGLFYISYYDAPNMNSTAYFYDYGAADNYDYNYQYDGSAGLSYYSAAYSANMYTAGSDETLKAVGFYTRNPLTDCTVEIYKGCTTGSPTAGTLESTTTVSESYAGFHTVELSEAVDLDAGDTYSVVIYQSSENYAVQVMVDSTFTWGWLSGTGNANSGESYISSTGSYWQDVSANGYNCRIKAYTDKRTEVSKVTAIQLNKTSASVLKGKSLQLKATITPSDATDKSVTWKSSNTKVATVSSSGKVTAKAAGTATITCTAKDGSGVKATCKVTVKNPVTKIKLNKTQAGLSPKETVQLKATVTPSNASNKSVTWKSSNTKVATVSSSGKVTAKKAGTATITCTAKDGSGKKATCKITVYTNTEAFVARIYTKALSRTAEADGLKYWTEEINSGRKTPVQVAESFFFAPEFTNKNLSNTEYVKVLYRTFMGREYDQGGLDYWLSRLAKGESRKSVLESFAGCQEFKDIVKSFGL